MNHPAPENFELAGTELPHRSIRGEVSDKAMMDSAVERLYSVISVLDSANQSDFAGRLHALTLEIRERAARTEGPKLS